MKGIFLAGFAALLAACVASPQEQQAWNDAIAKNTVESYRAYLVAYPKGLYSRSAFRRLETVLTPTQIQELLYASSNTAPIPSGSY